MYRTACIAKSRPAQACADKRSSRSFSTQFTNKLADDKCDSAEQTGWRAAFGTARPEDVAEVQRIIDEEFSRIDPEDWK